MSWKCCFALVFAVAAAAGCARVSAALDDNLGGAGGDGDMATPIAVPDFGDNGSDDLATPPSSDLATPPPADMTRVSDLATPADLAKPHDLAGPPPDLVALPPCHLVINEVQTQTNQQASEEFVEIYNPCTSAVTVGNWKLGYRAATNTTPASSPDSSTLYSFSGSLAAGAYFVLGGAKFTGTANGSLASGLAASGSVGLRDGSGNLVDSVAWGTITPGNAFIETAAAPLPPTLDSPGGSIERLPNGTDTNDNSHDFAIANAATPGAANH